MFLLPWERKHVVNERGTVFTTKNADIIGQRRPKSGPAVIIVVNNIEACVSVVQLQPLYTFWYFKRG